MGRRPLQGMSDEAILAAKLNFGSFSAISQGEKFSPTMAELLRGLLADKLAERWTVRNLDMWMLGQYFNPVLPVLPQRATRPIRFGGGEHISKPGLGHAMAWHWDEAVDFVDSGQLESWLQRGFNDEKAAEPLALIRGLAYTHGAAGSVKHRAVSRMIEFMGPSLPVCYKSIRVSVNALGTMLASVIDQAPVRTEFAELLRGRLSQGWLDQQPKSPGVVSLRRVLDTLDPLIDRPGPGFSIERALYELEPMTPCRSDLIADFCVIQLRDLLPAIDAALPAAASGTLPMDRHIAAFIAARIGRGVERELNALANMADQVAYRLGVLRLIAAVHSVHRGDNELPRLGETIAEMLMPVIDGFHRLKSRDELRNKVKHLAGKSDFQQLGDLLDDEGPTRQIDARGFAEAQRTYSALEKEAQWLEAGGLTHPALIEASARMSGAVTSSLLASAILAGFAVMMAM
jgi:hypothetical protein